MLASDLLGRASLGACLPQLPRWLADVEAESVAGPAAVVALAGVAVWCDPLSISAGASCWMDVVERPALDAFWPHPALKRRHRQRVQCPPRPAVSKDDVPVRRGPAPRATGPLAPWMEARLRRMSKRKRVDADLALRARMVLMLVRDPCVAEVARRLDVSENTVRLWRDRFLEGGERALRDRPRSGRPRRIDDATRCEVIAMACGRPKTYGVAHRQTWTFDTLHAVFRARHPEVEISRTSVLRLLTNADLRPHRMQGWMHSQDPDFRAKATHICSLYLHPPPGSVVLCVDEKTGMQALKRKHATKWAGLGRPGKWEYEYKRMGTCTLFGAFNTLNGHVFAEISKKRKARDLLRFMKALARHYPKGDVHIVWDNLNIHCDGPEKRWTAFNKQQGGRFHFHYTPLHASWVNQVELFFSRVQRRVLRYASFDSVADLGAEVLSFIDHWNKHERKPYAWTFRGYPLEEAKSAA